MTAVLLALAAALCNALTTIFQRLGVESAGDVGSHPLRLMVHVVRRPIWLLGFAAMLGSFVFQAVALNFGALTVVQPIMVTELVFLVVILRVFFDHEIEWRVAVGTVLTVVGLAAFLALSSSQSSSLVPSSGEWVLVVSAGTAAVVLCAGLARFGTRSWRSAWYGAAAAVAFAVAAAFTKTATILLRGGVGSLLTHFEPYGLVAAGLAGLVLTQRAFHAGPITASQATLTTVDPIASILIGVGVFGNELRGGTAALAGDAISLAVMCAGLFVLTNSPLIASSLENERLGRRTQPA